MRGRCAGLTLRPRAENLVKAAGGNSLNLMQIFAFACARARLARYTMPSLASNLDTRSPEFRANDAAMRALVDELRANAAKVSLGGDETSRERHVKRGKLLPRERVQIGRAHV